MEKGAATEGPDISFCAVVYHASEMTDLASRPTRERVTAYEALRGGAALAVVFGHSFFGFGASYLSKFVPEIILRTISSGNYAVTFFFVLSGFVLTRRHFVDRRASYLVVGALKRWPRLALMTTIATLTSCLMRALGLFWYQQAGALVNADGKEWLSHFGNGDGPPYLPDFWQAFTQGSYTTFIYGSASYDASMWTMSVEFYGSFIAFALAYLLGRNLLLALPISVFALPFLLSWSTFSLCFIAGVLMAYFLTIVQPRWPFLVSIALLTIGLVLPATHFAQDHFGPKGSLAAMAINMPCSLLAIAAIATSSKTEALLSGRAAAFLGRISFPLYLVHLLVLASLGCWLYVVVPQPYSAVVATAATVGVSIVCAALLAPIDAAWLRVLNGLVKRLLFTSPRDELANQRQASEQAVLLSHIGGTCRLRWSHPADEAREASRCDAD